MPRQLLGSRISTYMRLREGASLYDPGVTGGPSKISSPRPLSGLSGPIRRIIACASRSRALIHFLVSPFIRRQQKERSTASPPPIRHTLRDILIIQNGIQDSVAEGCRRFGCSTLPYCLSLMFCPGQTASLLTGCRGPNEQSGPKCPR